MGIVHDAFKALLPTGRAWNKEAPLFEAISKTFSTFYESVRSTRAKITPNADSECLDEWYEFLDLPEPWLTETDNVSRASAIRQKLTSNVYYDMRGMEQLIQSLGYPVTFRERIHYRCGVARCGHTMLTGKNAYFVWEIIGTVTEAQKEAMQVVFDALKPAHIQPVFIEEYDQ